MTDNLRDLAARTHGAAVSAADVAAGALVSAATSLAVAKGLPPAIAALAGRKALETVHDQIDRLLAERMVAPGVDAVGIKVERE